MMENIVISDPERLEKSKKSIAEGGAGKIHILSDFDRTLTKAFVDGKGIPSLLSILYEENYLTPDYASKAQSLYEKYHPIEIDPNIPFERKKMAMCEWWNTHISLLIKSGLNKKDLEKAVGSGRVKLRRGFREFSDFLKARNIPLIIMSSSGLGGDVILMYLKKEKVLHDNIHVISNEYEWDENGKAVAIKEPIIHCLSKYETLISDFPVYDRVKDRKNVLLIGDSLDDVGMVQGFDYDNLIKIGFLNENTEKGLEYFKRIYDAVLLNDSPMDFINDLLRKVAR